MKKRALLISVVILSVCLIVTTRGHRTDPPDQRSPSSGEPSLPSDIVGGERTFIIVHKHQVAIISRSNNVLGCGGSIINSNWIVTAAHCCVEKRTSQLTIRAGSSYYRRGGDSYYVAKIIYHADYDDESTDYDICVIKTTKPIVFGERVQPIAMVKEGTRHPPGTVATITGWGKEIDSKDASSSFTLRVVQLPIVSPKECREKYAVTNQSAYITDRQICAGTPTGGKDTCQGDSGGPMVIQDQLAGVTSWGIGCGNKNFPGVYANVAYFRSWIRRQTGV